MLRLISIAPCTPEISSRTTLWSEILRISIEVEGATTFTIDSTIPAGLHAAEMGTDEAQLASVGLRVDDPQRVLRPLQGAENALADLGPRVLGVDLYADRAWVAGVSDWGDEMDVLFGEAAWATLEPAIARICPDAIVDQAEALSRPTFSVEIGGGRRARGRSPRD